MCVARYEAKTVVEIRKANKSFIIGLSKSRLVDLISHLKFERPKLLKGFLGNLFCPKISLVSDFFTF